MEDKIKILFHNRDAAGVNYFRTQTPATQLERDHSDKFRVEFNSELDFNNPKTIDYLKSFHIIHYHRQLVGGTPNMLRLANELKEANVTLVMDIDDYWYLDKSHPYYSISQERRLWEEILDNLKIADYVTTTSDYFAEEIRKVTGKDNVVVLPNSVDPTWMKQFKNNWKPDPDGLVRITYMAGSCYDKETEILTENGWKFFKDLNKEEAVVTLNPKTEEIEYQYPSAYTNEYYEGDLYYGENKNINFAVTPNHNMFVSKVKSGNRKKPFTYELTQMENLDDYDLTFKKNGKWNMPDASYHVIDEYNDKLKTHPQKAFEMDDWLTFFGFWLGDGWVTKDGTNQVGVCGVKQIGVDKMEEIKTIMEKYGYNPTYTKDGKQLRIFNQQLWKYLSKFGGAHEKYIPKGIKNLSKRQLKILLDNYLIADGTIRKNGRISCDTVSKQLADDISEIALKIGVATTHKNRGIRESEFIKECVDSQGDVYFEKRKVIGKYDCHHINFYGGGDSKKSQLTPTVLRKNINIEKYEGQIYCVTVPNHILYVRRNGKSYWCGNSHKGDVLQLEGAIARLNNDSQTKGKFKIQLAGWDTEGTTTDVKFNQEFSNVLKRIGLWDKNMVNAVNKSRGNVDALPRVPNEIKEAFRNKVFITKERPIDSEQSIYLLYENVLTDNHNIIEDDDYLKWLNNYERNTYPNEGNFARRWTRKANIYAEVLNETDIAIAPLADHEFNHMKCVVGDTLINTNKGIIKIKDLVENKYDDLKILNNDVISYFKYDNEKTLKLKTNIGVELEGTPTHRIFVDDKWKPMSEFGVGDKIELTSFDFESTEYQKIHSPMLLSKRVDDITLECATKEMMPSITINEDYGRFFGYMIGDGHFSTNYLRISCDKRYDDVVKDIVKLSNKMGLHPKLIYDKIDKRCKTTISKEGYGVDINLTSKHLASICIQENLKNENGKVFEIPHFILKSPKSVIKEFLRGLFEADGTVSTDGSFVSLTSKSLILMKQVQTLLLGFDIIGKIDVAPNKRYKKNYYNLRLTRAASDMFYKEIGFVSEIKQEKLKLLTEKPHSNRFQEQNFEIIVTDIIENTNDVYDVEVDNIHKYNGNGIINHNSNLKQVECWSRKLPVVCTDVIPYNVDGRHMENCVLIPTSNSKGDKRKEKNLDKYWYKYLKQLILNPVLRKELGENLHRDFSEKYNLKNVTNKRAEFYESVVMEQLNIV